jgi:hypothetical protein
MANNENQDRDFSTDDNTQEQMPSQGETSSEGGSTKKSERGFAAMPKEQQRAIASKGGKAAHAGKALPTNLPLKKRALQARRVEKQ